MRPLRCVMCFVLILGSPLFCDTVRCFVTLRSPGFPGSSGGKESACSAGHQHLVPGSGRSPGEGNGNPLQYSCLENPMDRGACWATVHGVTKSRTWLSWLILCELFIVNLSLPECSSLNAPEYLISDWMNGGLAWGSNPFLYLWPYGSQFKTVYVCVCMSAKSLQSCLTLCHPMNCSPRGSSVRGVLQARIPEWVAISFSSGSSQPRDRAHVFYVSCIGRQVLYH